MLDDGLDLPRGEPAHDASPCRNSGLGDRVGGGGERGAAYGAARSRRRWVGRCRLPVARPPAGAPPPPAPPAPGSVADVPRCRPRPASRAGPPAVVRRTGRRRQPARDLGAHGQPAPLDPAPFQGVGVGLGGGHDRVGPAEDEPHPAPAGRRRRAGRGGRWHARARRTASARSGLGRCRPAPPVGRARPGRGRARAPRRAARRASQAPLPAPLPRSAWWWAADGRGDTTSTSAPVGQLGPHRGQCGRRRRAGRGRVLAVDRRTLGGVMGGRRRHGVRSRAASIRSRAASQV